MTSGHGEEGVFGALCAVILIVLALIFLVIPLDIAAIVTGSLSFGNECEVKDALGLSHFALSYGISSLLLHVLRGNQIIFTSVCTKQEGSIFTQCWFIWELFFTVARLLFFAFGIALLSMVPSTCVENAYSLYVVSVLIVIEQPFICCACILLSKSINK